MNEKHFRIPLSMYKETCGELGHSKHSNKRTGRKHNRASGLFRYDWVWRTQKRTQSTSISVTRPSGFPATGFCDSYFTQDAYCSSDILKGWNGSYALAPVINLLTWTAIPSLSPA